MYFQFWLYIIIAVIVFLARIFKKANERTADPSDQNERPIRRVTPTSTPQPGNRPLTFEELLKEITEAKKPAYTPPIQRQPEVVDYDDDLEDEEKDLEDVEYDYRKQDKIYDVYENAKTNAFSQVSLEETMKLEDTPMQFGKFKEFDATYNPSVLDIYVKDLRDPEGFKRAVVLSEILNRKF